MIPAGERRSYPASESKESEQCELPLARSRGSAFVRQLARCRPSVAQQESRERRRGEEDYDVADLAEQNVCRDDLGKDQRRAGGERDRRPAERTWTRG